MKSIYTILFLTITFISLSAQSLTDSVMSDAFLEDWLSRYAKLMSDTTNHNTAQVAAADSVPAPEVTMAVAVKEKTAPKLAVNGIKQPGDLLSAEDSLELHKRAILEFVYNPIFLDWVFYAEVPTTGVELSAEDSIKNSVRASAWHYVFQSAPELFAYHSDDLPNINEILGDKLGTDKGDGIKMKTSNVNIGKDDKITIVGPKKSNWSFGGQFQVQLSQLYISSNWYNGGESNLYSFLNVKGFANYNDKKRVEWENSGELKSGFISAGNDSLRLFRVNDDMLKFNSKLGIKAFSSFYYTAEAEMQTQLFNTFIPNTYERSTAPFSPIRFYFSVGMDYKYKDVLSIFVSPASYKLVYVADTTVLKNTIPPVNPENNIASKVGIEPGKKSLNQVGGLLRVNYKHKFTDEINLETKLSFYANYVGQKKGVEIDWEVIGNFVINRFFSAKVSLHPRYDNTIVLPEGEKNKIQFKELISIGFNYKI